MHDHVVVQHVEMEHMQRRQRLQNVIHVQHDIIVRNERKYNVQHDIIVQHDQAHIQYVQHEVIVQHEVVVQQDVEHENIDQVHDERVQVIVVI